MVATSEEVATAEDSARNNIIDPLFMDLRLEIIEPSPLNPRKVFDELGLQELAASIREHGLMQPLVVRPKGGGEANEHTQRFEIVAGERRWRACKIAGLERVTCAIVEKVDDTTALRLAITENLQRQDLDPIEEAQGYEQLHKLAGLKQAQIAAAVNRSQPVIANRMRLLKLPQDVQERVRKGELSAAHGIALAKYSDFPKLASKIAELAVENDYTAHQLEGHGCWLAAAEKARLVKQFFWDNWIDKKEHCDKCPDQAYRSVGYYGACLKPSCYHKLQKEAKEAKEALVKQRLESSRSEGGDAPRLSDLPANGYRHFMTETPVGCASDCEKRGRAQTNADRVIDICTDVKCYDGLLEQAGKEAERLTQQLYADAVEQMVADVDLIAEIGARELAVIAAYAVKYTNSSQAGVAFKRHGLDKLLPEKWDTYGVHLKLFSRLADAALLTLVKSLLEGILREELYHIHMHPQWGEQYVSRARWYLGLDPEQPPAESSNIEQDVPDVRTCRVCGCTDDAACAGGCRWVADPEGGDLCSQCAARMEEEDDCAQCDGNIADPCAGCKKLIEETSV
ncbi:MAG: ParB/RepB/Spo0J family partition protein [Dehalococcoidales bacterium]|nr:ParB/RepB/Spo0J family partition protein [Dehalococcoidales bacterium]